MALKTKGSKKLSGLSKPSTTKVNDAMASAASGTTPVKAIDKLASESRTIALNDIELNPDNELFRQEDHQEDIEKLAENIKSNGLLHNLVVYQVKDGEKNKYILLSGERRYKAIKYLYEEQKSKKWEQIENCKVVSEELTDNERRVILYSANLQVRGGIADEKVRRKANMNLLSFLQQAPYNMDADAAKAEIKKINAVTAKQIDRDFRIEEKLNNSLLALLDARVITRPESETFIKFNAQQQEEIAKHILALQNAGNADDNMDGRRNDALSDLIAGITSAQKMKDPDECDKLLAEAFADCNDAVSALEKNAEDYDAAASADDARKIAELDTAEALRTEKRRAAKREVTTRAANATFAEKRLQPITTKIDDKLKSGSFRKRIQNMDPERRNKDIEILDALIKKATELKKLMESAD